MKYCNLFIATLLLCLTFTSHAEPKDQAAINKFIERMQNKHQFEKADLEKLFESVEIKDSILKAISAPAEGMPWHKYRKIFITDSRIDQGIKFWQDNEVALAKVSEKQGVPAEIIVAIIGVETRFGGNVGSYRVIDALSTLGFAYPKRSKFFLSELESFLLLCRIEKLNPLEPVGSYAGAMGLPQFMPSSFLAYATDFEGDNHRDIWTNPSDAISSVSNYFAKHHWQSGKPVTVPVILEGDNYKKTLTSGLKPDITIGQLRKQKIILPTSLANDAKAKLFSFEQPDSFDHWIGLDNFYVITRYNHSSLYAMAVYQLSQAILEKR